ncbi:MAG: peptide chain release factor 1 [Ruminococcaceae bacterium]|nr:peptide chain release factor 1 [Oscillospiraceae bacterium]
MFNKLKAVENKYEELTQRLTQPEVLSDAEAYKKIATEHAEIAEIVEKYREYKNALQARNEARELLGTNLDEDFKALVKEEFEEAGMRMEQLEISLKKLLMPKDPNDNKNVIFEIRAGAGGEEAALFAAVLFRMYSMYAERHRWSVEIVDISDTGIGGIKEIVFTINGRGAYSRLKFESGVHRVQRVPATETGGRIHTSTATVAVLPEVDEVEVELNMNDVEVDTFRSSGAGGQHINKTESAIRLTHKPTGIVVTCQDEKSQLKNKEQAFKVLRSKLYEKYKNEQDSEVAQTRKSQVGTGDRSERIRTYNYTQNRVTDHRIDLTLYKLEMILNGDLEEVIDALITSDESAKLSVTEE